MPNRTAAAIMTRSVVTLSPDTGIDRAIDCLLKKKISGAPVVDETGRLVGILSEKDCLRVLIEEALDGVPEGTVKNYMTHPVATITPTTSLSDVVRLFVKMPFRRLPVLDKDGRVVGQVSRRDVLLAIESIRENSYLFGAPEEKPITTSFDEDMEVDSAKRIAREQSDPSKLRHS